MIKAAPVKAVVRTVTFPARAVFDGYVRFERQEVRVYTFLFLKGCEVLAGGALTKEELEESRALIDNLFDNVYTTVRVKFGITNEREIVPLLAA